jgi:hypothetical protein
MYRKTHIGLIICLFLGNTAFSQHFIGEHKAEVKKLMSVHRKELFIDKSSVNRVYNTLKYVDRWQNQTLLFVFSEDDICLYTKWMCDYSMMNKVVSELNEKYQQSAENTWHYKQRKKPYIITLSTGEWFFTITTRKEEKSKER